MYKLGIIGPYMASARGPQKLVHLEKKTTIQIYTRPTNTFDFYLKPMAKNCFQIYFYVVIYA
jgi:hypothetical protein